MVKSCSIFKNQTIANDSNNIVWNSISILTYIRSLAIVGSGVVTDIGILT